MTWSRRDAEPYQPGNFAALKHGARSPRKIAEEAERVHEELLEVCPWLDEERYAPTLIRYLQAAAREQLAHRAYMDNPTSRLLESATAAARLAWQMGDALGLTPAGHARLKAITAAAVGAEVNLAEVIERGHRRRLNAEARLAGELPAETEERL